MAVARTLSRGRQRPTDAILAAFLVAVVGCAAESSSIRSAGEGAEPSWSRIEAQVIAVGTTDVSAVWFRASCGLAFATEAIVPLEAEALPAWIAGGPGDSRFADFLFVAPAGTSCTIDASPLTETGAPSTDCEPAQAEANVVAGHTEEIVLTMPCDGAQPGAIDAVGTLNFAPLVLDVQYDPSAQILACTEGRVDVVAVDPEGEVFSVSWVVKEAPLDADYTITADGLSLVLSAKTLGVYVFTVTLIDPSGGQTDLDIPFFVSFNPDAPECQPDVGCTPVSCNDHDGCTIDACEDDVCVHTTLEEVCDGADNDCDGTIDDACFCPMTGDVNGSGKTNIADVQCALLVVLWQLSGGNGAAPACLGGQPASVADANCDGIVNVLDVQSLIRLALGLPPAKEVDPNKNGCVDACEPNPCGNGVCEPQEWCLMCPQDCGPCGGG